MRSLREALVAASLLLSCYVFAQSPCVTTKTISTVVTTPDTTRVFKTKTSTTTYFQATRVVDLGTTTIPTTSTFYITSSSTVILDAGTRTLGGYKVVKKSCPPGPSYVKRCPTWSSTDTEHFISTTYVGTVTSTSTWTSLVYVDQTTKIVKSTVTTGSPPTTKIVTSTQTQVTSTFSYQTTVYSTVSGVETATYTPTTVLDTMYTTSLPSPTATATVNLFSLQITNTSNPLDGYTWGQRGEKAVIQNATTWRYYISPDTGYLVHAPSGNYLAYTICDGEQCTPPLIFVPDKPRPPYDSITGPQPLRCKVGCGGFLQCWDASRGADPEGNYLAITCGDRLGSQFAIDYGGSWLHLQAVGPTRGR